MSLNANNDLRMDVIECIVDCPLMIGFENYGDRTLIWRPESLLILTWSKLALFRG